jgi:hypothetical protein
MIKMTTMGRQKRRGLRLPLVGMNRQYVVLVRHGSGIRRRERQSLLLLLVPVPMVQGCAFPLHHHPLVQQAATMLPQTTTILQYTDEGGIGGGAAIM